MRIVTRVRFHLLWCVLAAAAPVGIVGCGGGGGGGDHPKTVQVTGVVTYNGQPVEGATVTFSPNVPITQMAQAHGAFGKTDQEGKYTLTTFETGDGAVPGEYQVAISKYEGGVVPVDPNFNEETDYVPPEESQASAPPPKSLLPEKYSKPGTSGLTASVKDGGQNTFDFALSD